MPVSRENVNDIERITVLRHPEDIIKTYLSILNNIKGKWSHFADTTSLSQLPFMFDKIREIMLCAKGSRETRLRFITEITKDNLEFCKQVAETVEVRHLEGVKGNFAINDCEYISVLTTENQSELESPVVTKTTTRTTTTPCAVYSNVKEDIQQHLRIFEILWNKAIPAKQMIKEMEEGSIRCQTRIIEDSQEISKALYRLFANSKELDICLTAGGMQYSYDHFFEVIKKLWQEDQQEDGKHSGIRYVTSISKDEVGLARKFMDAGIRIRHVKNLPPMSFVVSDSEIAATIEKMEGLKMVQSLLLSSEPAYANHFKTIFKEIWKNGIDLDERINDINAGADLSDIEVIHRSPRARVIYFDLVKSAEKQILLLFPTTGAFIRQQRIGVIRLSEERAKQGNVHVRILMPADKLTDHAVQTLRQDYPDHISIRYIEKAVGTKATILVVDNRFSLVMELKDDSKQTFDEAIGLSTYSDSKAGVLSYAAIFEKLWQQSELYDKVKETNRLLESANARLELHQKMQQEFVNVAAHELRTPIQPILGMIGVIRSRKELTDNGELNSYLALIDRNAQRLKRLAENLLDVARIESQSLVLYKEQINLNRTVSDTIQNDARDHINSSNRLPVIFQPLENGEIIYVEAEKERVIQVIENLISNSIKVTKDGTIVVSLHKSTDGKQAIVSIKDSGTGIDQEIFPRLFGKFATNSFQGTGLGLFISKNIIEGHGGKIWAQNNSDGIGATFAFSLPLANNTMTIR
jgi:two-component system sensor histidine kinase VicK